LFLSLFHRPFLNPFRGDLKAVSQNVYSGEGMLEGESVREAVWCDGGVPRGSSHRHGDQFVAAT
jgi:hypothetical protein